MKESQLNVIYLMFRTPQAAGVTEHAGILADGNTTLE